MEKSDDEIRIAQGKYNSAEIIEIALKELSEKGFIILRRRFPDAETTQLDLSIHSIIKDNKYIVDRSPFSKEWTIEKNPNYINQFWHEVKIAIIGAVLTLVIGIVLWQLDKRSTTQDIQLLKDELKLVNQRLDSLQKSK
jgi:hypothetical protein